MNKELIEAMDILEKEKEISKETLFEAIENSLLTACKNHFGKADNIKVEIDRDTCDFLCYAEKEVVEEVEDDCLQISLEDAQKIKADAKIGDVIHVEIKSKEFGRIAIANAGNIICKTTVGDFQTGIVQINNARTGTSDLRRGTGYSGNAAGEREAFDFAFQGFTAVQLQKQSFIFKVDNGIERAVGAEECDILAVKVEIPLANAGISSGFDDDYIVFSASGQSDCRSD